MHSSTHYWDLSTTLGLMAAYPPSQSRTLSATAVPPPPIYSPGWTLSTGWTVLCSAASHAPPAIRCPGEYMLCTGSTVAGAGAASQPTHPWTLSAALGSALAHPSIHGRLPMALSSTTHVRRPTPPSAVRTSSRCTYPPPLLSRPASPIQSGDTRVCPPHRHMVDVSLVPVQEPRERCRRWERREGFQRLCANAFLLDALRGLDDVAGW